MDTQWLDMILTNNKSQIQTNQPFNIINPNSTNYTNQHINIKNPNRTIYTIDNNQQINTINHYDSSDISLDDLFHAAKGHFSTDKR